MDKEISIVVPVRNRAELIVRLLDSVKAQTYRPINIIVVDNGSTDDTFKAVKDWGALNCTEDFTLNIIEEPTPGACAARNRGLQMVRTEWMLFFDSDDVMRPRLVERVMNAIKENPEVKMIYWKSILKGIDGFERHKKYSTSNHWRNHIYNSQFCTQCYAAKTNLFKRVGGWNENLPVWNDWELGVRLLLANPKRIGIDEVLTNIYAQKRSITGLNFHSRAGEWERAIEEAEKAIEESRVNVELKHRLLDMINYRRINLASIYRRENHPEPAERLEEVAAGKNRGMVKWMWLKLLGKYTEWGGRGAYKLWR